MLHAETSSAACACLSTVHQISCETPPGLKLLCVHVKLTASAAAQPAEAPCWKRFMVLKSEQVALVQAPLLFYECQYQNLHFRRSADAQRLAVAAAEGILHQNLVGKLLSTCLLERACKGMAPAGRAEVKHIPLLKRAREPDIAARLQKARRLQNTDLSSSSPGEPASDSVNLDYVCLV